MAEITIQTTIMTKFETDVETPQSLAGLVEYDNAGNSSVSDEFVPPSIDPADPSATKWVRFTVRFDDSDLSEIGGATKKFRTHGTATAMVFVPAGTGSQVALTLAGVITNAFKPADGAKPGGITYRKPKTVRVGRDGPWFQWNVEIPFLTDET